MKNSIYRFLFLLLVPLLMIPVRAHSQAYSFRVAGATNTYIMGINDYQWVAGYYTDAQGTHGFIYNQTDTIRVNYPGAVNTYFYDINVFGEAVGAYNSGSANNNVGFIYNIYTQTATTITSWISGYQQIIPYKITNAGDVAGSYHLNTNNWIFTIIGGINTGSLHYNYNPTYGIGLNSQDMVVGFYINSGQNHGFIRSIGGTYSTFDYPGAFKTKAFGINDSSVIVGEYNNTHGFMYKTTAPSSFTEILLPGSTEVHPYDINNYGIIAGYFKDATGAMAGFILMDRFVPELAFENPALTSTALGVVADGSARMKLIVNRTNGNTPINSIKIELEDKNLQPDVPLGKMKAGPGAIDSSVVVFNNPSGTNQWNFIYQAPDLFTHAFNTYEQYRDVRAKFTFHNNATNTDFKFEKLIRIIRPPVLLIHGLKSNGSAFQNCADYLIATGRYTKDFVEAVDYKATNDVAYTENAYVLPTSILKMKTRCHILGYEVSKVDIAAHSMGAILSRLYLQSSDYGNDIHKLIPVNSPLSGSQGANLLMQLPYPVRWLGGITGQAFTDLNVTSDAIRSTLNGPNLNNRVVPSHTITSTATNFTPIFGRTLIGAAMYIAFEIYFNSYLYEQIPPIIYDGPSDLIVAENSQYAGCTANSHINDEWHCGITANQSAKETIKMLLEAPVSEPYFSMGGFHPPTLYWNGQKAPLSPVELENSTDSVHFSYPPAALVKANGDSLNIQFSGTSGIQKMILYIKESQDTVFLLDTITNNLSYTWTIPELSCGKVPMYVIGLDQSNHAIIDSTFIMVEPEAIPDSIFIQSPSDSLILSQGLPGSLNVSCRYSDNIVRDITSLPAVSYQLHTNKALNLSGGTFKGIQPGRDTVTVIFSGLSVSLPINIGSYYAKYDTVNIYGEICSGQTYTFNGQALDTAGTYSYSLLNQYGRDSTIILHLTVSLLIPDSAGVISGPAEVLQGQTGVTYTVPLVQNASTYTWILPPGVIGNSTSNTINLNFSLLSDSCIIGVHGVNGCGDGSSSYLVIHLTNKVKLMGTVSYDNAASTPLSASTVILKQNGSIISQVIVDQYGNFLFENLDPGIYQISVLCNKPWGGVNAVDALTIMHHFVGTTTLTGIRYRAADVNASSSVNSVDALLALRRFVGLISGFSAGDWLWDSDGVNLNLNSNLTLDIKGLCVGDVNGSYIPPDNQPIMGE